MQTSLTRSWQTSQAQNSQDSQTSQVSAKTSKMLKALCLGAFVACVAQAQNLDAEIERLEKQKKILELKRQNNQLQKELDRTGTRSNPQNSAPNNYPNNYQNTQGNYPNNYPNQKSKQNYPKGNQPQYYGPPTQNQQQNKARYYYEEEEDDEEEQTYYKDDKQFYIRLEGGYHIGLGMGTDSGKFVGFGMPHTSLELGLKVNDNTRVFLGSSFAWTKGNQFIVDGYLGVGWIPALFDSPVRYVLDAYIGGSYGRWNWETTDFVGYDKDAIYKEFKLKSIYKTERGRDSGAGFLVGAKTGLAFDIGRHIWLEFGARLQTSLGSLMEVAVTPYGSFSVLF